MSFQIKDKVALVTGANRGIGAAIVEALISAGALKVYAAARNTDELNSLVHRFQSCNAFSHSSSKNSVKGAGNTGVWCLSWANRYPNGSRCTVAKS